MSDRLMRAALTWAERGWHVFPCAPGGKPPAIPDQDWHGLATTDPRQIRRWWAARPYNIGIDCGRSGLVVVDLDIPGHGRRAAGEVPDRNTGLDTLIHLCASQGQPVPGPTFTAATPSGGLHLYFGATDLTVGNSTERLGGQTGTVIRKNLSMPPGPRGSSGTRGGPSFTPTGGWGIFPSPTGGAPAVTGGARRCGSGRPCGRSPTGAWGSAAAASLVSRTDRPNLIPMPGMSGLTLW